MANMKKPAKAPDNERRYITECATAGIPKTQLERFLSAGYYPQPKQMQFHAAARRADQEGAPNMIGFGGARGGAKTHCVFAQIALDDCQRVPNLKVLFLRKVGKAAKESIRDLRIKILSSVPHKFNGTSSTITFPNGSFIIVGNFKNESDIDKYLGLEYDVIVLEEATQLTKTKYQDIQTVNRNARSDFRPRMYLTTNPGGVGHGWFKEDFVIPYRAGKDTDTLFIPATIFDNVFVNKEYRKKLEKLTGWKKKAWLDGDWDVLAGQFFTTFNHEKHAIEPAKIFDPLPANASIWAAMDYGFQHYTAVLLLMKYDGHIYVLAEHMARRTLVKQQAKMIKNMIGRFDIQDTAAEGERRPLTLEDIHTFVAGTDVFAQGKDRQGETVADQYSAFDIFLEPATMDRINGASRVLDLLGDDEHEIEPRISISTNCVKLLACLPSLEHDPKRPEDVLKVDCDEDGNGGDDPYDVLRYGTMVEPSQGVWI